jgi:hypothetical protein
VQDPLVAMRIVVQLLTVRVPPVADSKLPSMGGYQHITTSQ